MLGKLISLLLHAKSGAISGVFLLGATGALVSASAANGVTRITITEASPSPSASASHSASPTPSASPTATPTHTATPSPTASPSGSPQQSSASACSDQAKALAFQVQRVDRAFSGFHTDLMKLRAQRSVKDIETADVMLKVIRQAAVKAIHATATQTCKTHDDDEDANDEDEDEAHDAVPATTLTLAGDRSKHEANDGDHPKTKPAPMTFTGDATAIADQAIAALQVAFDTAKNAPASTPKPKPTHTPHPSKSPQKSNNGHRD